MDTCLTAHPFTVRLSFKPLIDYAQGVMSNSNTFLGNDFHELLAQAPELNGFIEDLSLLEPHQELLTRLMHLVFPSVFWESRPYAAIVPFDMTPVFYSPRFAKLFLDSQGRLAVRRNLDEESFNRGRAIKAYLMILRKFYGIQQTLDYPLICSVSDEKTGLDRHYQFHPDLRFVDVEPLGELKKLGQEEMALVKDNLTRPEVLATVLPPNDFIFSGFTVFQAVEVTKSVVISALERDLIDQQSLVSLEGFQRLQGRLRTLFGRPDIHVGLAAVMDDEILLLSQGCALEHNCIFADSKHISKSNFMGTTFERILHSEDIIIVPDALDDHSLEFIRQEFQASGMRSLLIAPLYYQGKCIGGMEIKSPHPGDLGPMDALILSQLQPLFAIAIKRALDDLGAQVEAIIKEKCTSVHPVVEWRFRQAAFRLLGTRISGAHAEMEPIVFSDVYPIYGGCDIRGSSIARNKAVEDDLSRHLRLGLKILESAKAVTPLPIYNQLSSRLERHLTALGQGLGSGDESAIISLMRRELEQNFDHFRGLGPKVIEVVEEYEREVDSQLGTVYLQRRLFEKSVSLLNERLTTFLDKEEKALQNIVPHYFQLHRTDGVDYLIYAGDSLMEHGGFNALLLKSLRQWQLTLACGLGWYAEHLREELPIKLEATHLILVQDSSFNVRFRFDEKRFDVDGAYDIRYEIIRSRLDKATLKDTNERLTQPGRIAVVYTNPPEGVEMRRHIEYLQEEGFLNQDLEKLDLEDLPGVQGLKALRVGINLSSEALRERCLRMAG